MTATYRNSPSLAAPNVIACLSSKGTSGPGQSTESPSIAMARSRLWRPGGLLAESSRPHRAEPSSPSAASRCLLQPAFESLLLLGGQDFADFLLKIVLFLLGALDHLVLHRLEPGPPGLEDLLDLRPLLRRQLEFSIQALDEHAGGRTPGTRPRTSAAHGHAKTPVAQWRRTQAAPDDRAAGQADAEDRQHEQREPDARAVIGHCSGLRPTAAFRSARLRAARRRWPTAAGTRRRECSTAP